MQLLDLTLDTAQENLALDEALLEEAESASAPRETLRLWEPASPVVVVGRSSQVGREVKERYCRQHRIPIVRRCSGGAAIVAGPGCLLYGVILSYQRRPELRMIEHAHRFVLGVMCAALRPQAAVEAAGISDLVTADGRKFSGNSLRCRRRHMLYHGTLMYDFPLKLIGQCLKLPPRAPKYRQGRSHDAFVANVPLPADVLRRAVKAAWHVGPRRTDWPRHATRKLVAAKYGQADWNFRH
jgi:lipoate-protein ligase A